MRQLLFILFALCLIGSCGPKKDVGEILVINAPINKRHYKTHDQFIQIAYIDLFNKTIEPQRLNGTKQVFDSQGDDDINYDLFIKEIIHEASASFPSDSTLKENPGRFVEQSYLRFLGRYPNAYEKKILVDEINTGKSASAGKIYYILMTSEEYRMF